MPLIQGDGNLQYECEECNVKIWSEGMLLYCPSCNSSFKDYKVNCCYCKRSVSQNDVETCHICNGKICKNCITHESCPNHITELPNQRIN